MAQSRNILLVDEDQEMRGLLAADLRVHGYATREVDSVDAALAAINIEPPRIVIAHTRMPGKGGLDLLETLRSDPQTCTIVVVLNTAWATEEEIFRGFRSCSDAHIDRPVRYRDFSRFLDRIMQSPEPSPDEHQRLVEHMMRYFGPKPRPEE